MPDSRGVAIGLEIVRRDRGFPSWTGGGGRRKGKVRPSIRPGGEPRSALPVY